LGALVAALDADRLGILRRRYRTGLLVGVLRAWLGWLVVLGSGGERLVHALAGRHRSDSFAGRDGKTRRLQELDGSAGHRRVLLEPAGYLPGTFGRAYLGTRVRDRSGPGRVHPGVPVAGGRRFADAVRVARAGGQESGGLRLVVAGNPAAGQQPAAGRRYRDDTAGNALSIAARCLVRRQALRRPAVLQRDVPAADRGIDADPGRRRSGALEGY